MCRPAPVTRSSRSPGPRPITGRRGTLPESVANCHAGSPPPQIGYLRGDGARDGHAAIYAYLSINEPFIAILGRSGIRPVMGDVSATTLGHSDASADRDEAADSPGGVLCLLSAAPGGWRAPGTAATQARGAAGQVAGDAASACRTPAGGAACARRADGRARGKQPGSPPLGWPGWGNITPGAAALTGVVQAGVAGSNANSPLALVAVLRS